jgi:hypothetical protein
MSPDTPGSSPGSRSQPIGSAREDAGFCLSMRLSTPTCTATGTRSPYLAPDRLLPMRACFPHLCRARAALPGLSARLLQT